MRIVTISEPKVYQSSELTEPVRFVVDRDFGDRFAVTIDGNWRRNPQSEDRFDGPLPPITVDCGYRSKGLLLYRLDNADISPVIVRESSGTAFEVRSLRQCQFQSVRVHRCEGDSEIVLLSGDRGSYSSNMLHFGQMVCMACDAPTTVRMANAEKNAIRLISFGSLYCHPAWGPLRRQFPLTAGFGARRRVHVDFGSAYAVTISSLNCRMDRDDPVGSLALLANDDARDIEIVNGQILQQRGADVRGLVSGPIRVGMFR